MVRATCQDPRGHGGLEVGPWHPERAGDRQLGQRCLCLHSIDLIHDHAEAIACVHDGCYHCGARLRVKYQTYGIRLTADGEWVYLQAGLYALSGNRLAYLQHVRAKDLVAVRPEVISVILHEGGS